MRLHGCPRDQREREANTENLNFPEQKPMNRNPVGISASIGKPEL